MNEMKEAIRLYYCGEIFEAEKILKSILEKDPENIGALIRYAGVQEDLGRKEEAGSVYLQLARIHEEEANDEECLEALDKASSVLPPIDVAPIKGACLYRLGRYKEALECFVVSPQNIQNLLYIGKSYFALNQYQNALKTFREILARATNSEETFQACYWIGKCQYYLGHLTEAVACLKSFISVYPGETQAYFDLALCLLNTDCLAEAANSLLKYQKLGGNLGLANLYLGIVYCRMGNYQQAIECLNEAPLSEQSMYWKGFAYYEIGFYENALSCFSEAAKMVATPLYVKMAGKAHLKLGNYFEAKFCFEKALDGAPGDEELKKLAAIARHYLRNAENI